MTMRWMLVFELTLFYCVNQCICRVLVERAIPPSSRAHQPILVSIEGNIGAGKSTLLSKLRNYRHDILFIDEPVDIWTSQKDGNGDNLLELFYNDKRRWAYTFQTFATVTRYEKIQEAIADNPSSSIFLTERCLDTDFEVFTKMLVDDGSIDELEFGIYQRVFRQLRTSSTSLSGIIHVDTPPSLCLERIRSRGRGGEDVIPLPYLENLSRFQKRWLETTNVPVLHTDGNTLDDVEQFLLQLDSSSKTSDYAP